MAKNNNKIKSIRKLAHDLNNILSPLIGYTELALDGADPDSLVSRNLKQVHKAANRAKYLVQEILDLSQTN